MLQHGAYTLLMDACYDREKFPTMDEAIEWTWASTTAEIEAVQFVLRKFFALTDGVYVQTHIQEVIDDYQKISSINKRIAQERESNRKNKSTNRVRTVNEAPPNHKPLTTNHKPLKEYPIAFESVWSIYPQRPGASKPQAFKAWNARIKSGVSAQDIEGGVYRYKDYLSHMRTEAQYIKQPATFFGPNEHYLEKWEIPQSAGFTANGKFDPLAYAHRNKGTQTNEPIDITPES